MIYANDSRFFREGDAAALQAAVQAAASEADRTLVIPRYNARRDSCEWLLERALVLPSDFQLVLDNCRLRQAPESYDNLLTALPGAAHITVRGEGNVLLEGGAFNHLTEKNACTCGLPALTKNALMLFAGVSGLRLENLHLSCARWRSVYLWDCRAVSIRNITLYNRHVPRTEAYGGIYIEAGCRDICLENICGRSGGDSVQLAASGTPPQGSGLEAPACPDIESVTLRNIKTDPMLFSVVHLAAEPGTAVRHLTGDTLLDASHYYDKKHTCAVLEVGACGGGKAGTAEDLQLRHLISRSEKGISLEGNVKNAHFRDYKTYGDSVSSMKTAGVLENVTLEDFFHGAGLTANNRTSFFGRASAKATALVLGGEGDITLRRLQFAPVKRALEGKGSLRIDLEAADFSPSELPVKLAPDCRVTGLTEKEAADA